MKFNLFNKKKKAKNQGKRDGRFLRMRKKIKGCYDKYISFKAVQSLEKPWFTIWVILILYLLGLIGTSVSVYSFKVNSPGVRLLLKIFPLPAVIIDSQAVPVDEVYERMEYIQNFNQVSQQEMPSEAELREQVMGQLIDDYFYRIGAIDAGVMVSSVDVEAVYQEKIVKENGGEEAVKNAVESLYGMTIADLKRLIRVQLIKEKVASDGLEQVDLKMIVVADEATGKKVIEEISKGKSFEDGAREYSRDEKSKGQGGAVGWVARGQLDDPAFVEKLFTLPIGELVKEPINSQFGYTVVRVDGKKGQIEKSIDRWMDDLQKSTRVWWLLK